VTRLHHVNVTVPPGCTDQVVEFYELLGLTRLEKPAEGVSPSGAWFGFPGSGQQLHVSERTGDRNSDQHFAVVVDDFDAVVTGLRDGGHPFSRKPDVLGARRGDTADAYGNTVEVIEPAGDFTTG
jgi:hypothetical protein